MSGLAGAVAVVTGAGGGIGRALARELAGRDATVWLVGRSRGALEETAHACGTARARIRPTDLTDDACTDALVREIGVEAEGIDILTHCAGVIGHGTIEETAVEELDRQYRANVRVFYGLLRRLLPMLRSSQGQIVVINSSIVSVSRAGVAQFAATQHALRAVTDTLRHEVNDDGIRVLSVFPGRTATSRQEELYEREGREYRSELLLQPEDLATMIVAALTLPRTAEVTDIHIRPMLKPS